MKGLRMRGVPILLCRDRADGLAAMFVCARRRKNFEPILKDFRLVSHRPAKNSGLFLLDEAYQAIMTVR